MTCVIGEVLTRECFNSLATTYIAYGFLIILVVIIILHLTYMLIRNTITEQIEEGFKKQKLERK